jgi:hypothetical protein
MSDLGTLKARVGAATRRIVEASTARRSQNHSLMQSLCELESQFRNHERELAVLLARLGPLERSNAELVAMIDRLAALAESLDGTHLNTDLFRASSMAGDLVGLTARLERGAEVAVPAFDDVPEETLAAERDADDEAALPEPVVVAMAAAAALAPRKPAASEDIHALFKRAEAAVAKFEAPPPAAAPKRPRRKRARKAA